MLKDYAIELEIKRDFYHDMIVLTASSANPDKFSILDTVQKLYNQQYKTSIEKLIEGYKKEFGSNKDKRMTIRTADESRKKVSDLIAKMPTQ